MADNVTANSGSGGAVFASDDIAGVQFPRIKLVYGADGVNSGDVAAANPLPVKVTNGTQVMPTGDAAARAIQVTLSDGTNATPAGDTAARAISVASAGAVAHDAADSGNPVKIGGKAANALPTAVANADRSDAITDLWGRQLVTHIDPAMQVRKSFNTTSTQTGAAVWTPASGKKIAITSVQIGAYGTTAARLILWFGGSADTTYTEGTDDAVVKQSFAPSANGFPGLVYTPAVPYFHPTADDLLRVTTDAAMSVDIVVTGYEF